MYLRVLDMKCLNYFKLFIEHLLYVAYFYKFWSTFWATKYIVQGTKRTTLYLIFVNY